MDARLLSAGLTIYLSAKLMKKNSLSMWVVCIRDFLHFLTVFFKDSAYFKVNYDRFGVHIRNEVRAMKRTLSVASLLSRFLNRLPKTGSMKVQPWFWNQQWWPQKKINWISEIPDRVRFLSDYSSSLLESHQWVQFPHPLLTLLCKYLRMQNSPRASYIPQRRCQIWLA